MKKQIDIPKKEYQGLDKAFKFDKKEGDETINKDDEKPILKMYKKLDLMHDGKHSFYKYGDIKKYDPTNLALEDYNYDENFTERSDYSTVTFYGEELDDFHH